MRGWKFDLMLVLCAFIGAAIVWYILVTVFGEPRLR